VITDPQNAYRSLLDNDPPDFLDRVNNPWDQVPDLEEYNDHAFRRIVRALRQLLAAPKGHGANSQGMLILGEAGTGKTHLLMRVAKKLSKDNHILFVRKPSNEEAVAQHIWANMVESLARPQTDGEKGRSQLDDLLAHVFTAIYIPLIRQDVELGKDADRKQRLIRSLEKDPYNFFRMLGDSEDRARRLELVRKKTLRFLQQNSPDVDQEIVSALITYCLYQREDRKHTVLTWLSGKDN